MRDNGPGIPEDIRRNLFDPFVTSKPSGSGLGLALVAKIVADHGGLIEVDSRPGRTEFRLHLPMLTDDAAQQILTPASGTARAMTPPTVLIADDDRSIRTVLTQALGRSGYQVRSTVQRRDAVALGGGRRGRPGDHRRGDARRERARPDPAHQAGAAGACASW